MSNGNFCEVQLGVKPEKEEHSAFATKPGTVTQMHHECNAATGEVTKLEDTRINTADQANGLPGILASARTPWGSPTNEIKDDTILTLNGVEMRADNAFRTGLIHKDAHGRYL